MCSICAVGSWNSRLRTSIWPKLVQVYICLEIWYNNNSLKYKKKFFYKMEARPKWEHFPNAFGCGYIVYRTWSALEIFEWKFNKQLSELIVHQFIEWNVNRFSSSPDNKERDWFQWWLFWYLTSKWNSIN